MKMKGASELKKVAASRRLEVREGWERMARDSRPRVENKWCTSLQTHYLESKSK